MELFIYTLSNPETNEVRYVGKTKNPKDRLKRHLQRSYLDKYEKNTHKSRWIKTLLKNNQLPIMEILDSGDEENINQLEIYWISQMRQWGFDLTNLSIGGEVGVDWKGRHHTQETKDKIKKSRSSKPVTQYDLSGNILDEYESLIEASKETGTHIYLISNCCKKKSHYTVGGKHFWRHIEEDNKATTFRYKGDIFDYTPYDKNTQISNKKICKYDLNGNLVELYTSIKSASINNHCLPCNISNCCKNKLSKSGRFIVVKGFTWRYFIDTNGNKISSG